MKLRGLLANTLEFLYRPLLAFERVTGAHPTIDSNHAQIHARNAYTLRDEISVAQAKVGVIQLTVPAGAYVHMQDLEFKSDSGPAYVTIMKSAALTSEVGASALTPVNNHHLNPKVSVVGVKALADAGVTNGAGAYQVAKLPLYGTGAGSAKVSADSSSPQENILAQVTYTIAFSHSVVGTCKFGYKIFWYEEGGA